MYGVGEVADFFFFFFFCVCDCWGVVVVRWWVAELLYLIWWLLEK